MEERHAERDGQHAQRAKQLRCCRRRNTKHAEPSSRAQRLVALPPVIATDGIGDERHAFSLGEPVEFDRPVLRAVVDGRVQCRAAFRKACLPLLAVP